MSGFVVAEGPLTRWTNAIHRHAVVGVLVALAVLPGTVPWLALERDPSNLPLFALCLLPVGPAFSAALFALRVPDDAPARAFWRGYRTNIRDVLALWAPTLVALTVLAMNVAYADALGMSAARWFSAGVGIVVLAWWGNALAITSAFAFHTRDVARLAVHYLLARPLTMLGTVSAFVCAVGVAWLFSDGVLVLVAVAFVRLALVNERAVLEDVERRFVDPQ